MSTPIVILILLALLLLIVLPGVVALTRRRAAVWAIPFYLLLFGGIGFYYGGHSLGERRVVAQPQGAAPAGLCEEAVMQSERGGLILDRSNPSRVTVNTAMWMQLPEQAKQALTHCLDTVRPASARQAPIEIVEAPGR